MRERFSKVVNFLGSYLNKPKEKFLRDKDVLVTEINHDLSETPYYISRNDLLKLLLENPNIKQFQIGKEKITLIGSGKQTFKIKEFGEKSDYQEKLQNLMSENKIYKFEELLKILRKVD